MRDDHTSLKVDPALALDATARKQLIAPTERTREELESTVREHTERLLETERQLMQNEKLASVGQLAAGIAHEINTPIQYVGDNLRALQEFFSDLMELIEKYRCAIETARGGAPVPAETLSAVDAAEQEYDLDYIRQDAPLAIAQALEGAQRVAHIVRAMKDFSHVQREERAPFDLNHSIESTLIVARNEYKYHSDLVTDLGEIPPVEGYVSEINQVLLNMLVNAAHAIADKNERGTITIRSYQADPDHVEVTITDTGTGIPPEIHAKIFDPFFTTKEVGKGTGQGLYMAHQVIVQKHNGTLTFETKKNEGTTFFIRLPIRAVSEPEQDQAEADHEAHPVCG